MRTLWLTAAISCALATPALACEFHGAATDYLGLGYQSGETYAEWQARQEAFLQRENAMAAAKQAFLSRFDIKTDDSVQLASAPANLQTKPATNADRSSKSETQNR